MTAEAHRRVVVEYLRAVMAKRISFRSPEERKEGAERMVREAEQLRFLFRKLASVSATTSCSFRLAATKKYRCGCFSSFHP